MRYNDVRVAARVVAKNPLSAALSVISIALGIGLTTSVFSMADALFLRPLPIAHPSSVLTVTSIGDDGSPFMYGWPDYEDMRRAGARICDLAAYQRRGGMLANNEGGSDMVLVSPATPNFFPLLGVRAALGRAAFDTIGGRPGAVIGWRLWQTRFGGDPGIIGKTIILSGTALAVIGVMPREFGGLERGVANDIWVSTDAWFDALGRGDRANRFDQFEFVARLKPAVSVATAAAQLDASIRGPGRRKPAPAGVHGTTLEAKFAPGWKKELIFGGGLLAVLALVLFVACANVAQLRLAQAEARKKEIGMRLALGARGSRIVGLLLLETALVAVPGAALGLLLARALLAKAVEFLTTTATFVDPGVRLDHRVLIFTTAATLIAVLIAGLPPARLASRLSISEVLKSEQGSTGRHAAWRQKLLMAGQAAVAVAMLGTTLLFLQSLTNATSIRPGFDPSKKLLAIEAVRGSKVPNDVWAAQVCERLAALPGARAATFARRLPLSESGGGAMVRIEMPGRAPRAVRFNNVAGNYFAVMGTRVLAGRGIDTNDRRNTPPVVVVSETFARQFLPGRNPLGAWIPINHKQWQVVGVAADAPSNDLHEPPAAYIYFAYSQTSPDDLTLLLETVGNPGELARAMNQEIKRYDPDTTLYGLRTLRQHMDTALASDRLMTATATALGFFSIVLMAAGLFGVLQHAVAQRTRELGLRLALGASPTTVERLILGEALRIAAWGIPIGLGLLAALAWAVRAVVLGVSALDARLYVSSAAAVLAIVVLSAWLPAHRATRIDPMESLRAE